MARLERPAKDPAKAELRAVEVDALWHLGRALAICTAACLASLLDAAGEAPARHADATCTAAGTPSIGAGPADLCARATVRP